MKKAYRESLKKVFVSLFIFFYTFLPYGFAIADIVNEFQGDNAAPMEMEVVEEEIVEEVLPEEEIKEEEAVVNPEGEKLLKDTMSYPVWDVHGDTAITYENVELGKLYTAPQDSRVRVIFTKLPEVSSKLTIEKIILTQEEIDITGAISNIAYDITTDMENGTFEYDLELPSTEDDVKIVYVEEREDIFTNLIPVDNEIIKKRDTVKIFDLEHFTTFIVSGIWPTTSNNSIVNGRNTNHITWPRSGAKSGLEFVGETGLELENLINGDEFILGELTHYNHPVSSAIIWADLKITLGLPIPVDFTFRVEIDETSNTSSLKGCPDWQISKTPCDDKITFPDNIGDQIIEIDGVEYTLIIDGFKRELGGETIPHFITEENKDSTAYLVAHFVPIGRIVVEKITDPVNPNKTFSFSTTGAGYDSFTLKHGESNQQILPVGDYQVSESLPSGWTLVDAICISSKGEIKTQTIDNLQLEAGETITCTFTNTTLPTLTVYKVVNNDNGGEKEIEDFPLYVNDVRVLSGETNIFNPDTYTVSEEFDSGTYTQSFSGDCDQLGKVSLATGESKTCTITNNDIAPSLTLVKEVDKNYGGTANPTDWTLTATGPTNISGSGGATSGDTFEAGTYILSESEGPKGYSAGSWSCTNNITVGEGNSIVLDIGQSTTCTITNSDIQPLLTVTKIVVGSDKEASAFNLYVGDTQVTSGQPTGFNAGIYTVREDVDTDYNSVIGKDCAPDGSITLALGDTKECTITNTRKTGQITFTKNISHGDASPSNWVFAVYKGDELVGTYNHEGLATLNTGEYTVQEIGPTPSLPYYLDSIGGTACTGTISSGIADLTVTESGGTCVFGNTKKPTIIVKKLIEPTNSQDTFEFTVNGETFILGHSGVKTIDVMPGSYTITESGTAGYRTEILCDGDIDPTLATMRTISLKAGDNKLCTFTNTKLGSISGTKWNDENGNGIKDEGEEPVQGVQICIDANTNGVCDTNEVSVDTDASGNYIFSDLLPGTYNIIEILNEKWEQTYPTEGSYTVELSAGEEETDYNFGNWELKPEIKVVKASTTTSITDAGQVIPYTFTVTNTGNQTLTGITVTDPRCTSAPEYQSGDINGDNELQTDETWTYTCNYTVQQSDIDTGGNLSNKVTANSAEVGPVEDTLNIPITQSPDMSVTKEADVQSVNASSQIITYTIKVFNKGNTTLTNVSVEDPLLPNLDCDDIAGSPYTTSELTIDVGSSLTCTGTYTVTQNDIDSKTKILNTVTANNTATGPKTADEEVDVVKNPGMTVEKSSTTTLLSSPQTVSYSYLVTNTGNTTLTGITLSDDNDNDDMACPKTTLQVNEDMTCTATHTFTQEELDTIDTLDNIVTANSEQTEPVTDDLSIPISKNPKLSIVKSGSWIDANEDGYANVGEIVNYEFVITNIGNITLTGITVTDPLTGLSIISCPVTTLAVGEDTTCTATYAITQNDIDKGKVENTATADSEESEEVTDNDTVELPQNPLLSIVKSGSWADVDGDGYADVGETISYTFTVTNEGNVTLTNVTVTDPLVTVSGGPITLGVGETDSTTFTATYTITQDDIDKGSFYNIATAVSEESDEVTDDDTVELPQNPKLSIEKTGVLDTGDDDITNPGDLITYTFKVTNIGNITLTGITVTDPLIGGTLASCSKDTLLVGEDTTCTATYAITQNDIDAGEIKNTATADSEESDEVTDDETTELPQNPALSIVKTANPETYSVVGDEISYSYQVTNTGNVTMYSITVEDDKVTVTCPDTSSGLAPLDTITCTASYTIVLADLDDGSVINTAYATDGTTESDTVEETVTSIAGKITIQKYVNSESEQTYKQEFEFEPTWTENFFLRAGESQESGWLTPGQYNITEIVPTGWILVGMECKEEEGEIYLKSNSINTVEEGNITLREKGNILCTFTNEVIEPLLEITKENDTGGAGMYPGDTVTYTITVTTPSDEKEGTYVLKDIIVTDLLPEGFTYIPGSWTGTTAEPVYSNNLAKWYLGDIQEGDTVILTYKALISPTQEPGIYPDIAWTKGTSLSDNEVLGNVSTGALSPFVGTEVLVIGEYDIEEGEVLGISTTTTLPSTGASKYITIGALISMLLGLLSLIFKPSTSKRKSLLVVSILTIGIFALVKPNIAYAEGGLSTDIDIRIEQPETKTNKNTFNLGYVVLDTKEREIKVKCIEETYGTFDTHSTNSGNCKIDSSVVTGSGTYNFYVEVTAKGGEKEKSKTVTVNIDLSKPQAVKEYSKTEEACSYTLSFKSSTAKVQIFRSDNQVSFFANASTLITKPHLTVIPNNTSTYIDNDLPDCTKTYYYAIRSIDDYNNVSTLITDDIVTTVTAISPTTTATTSTPTTLTAITTDSGEVEGEITVDKDSTVEKEEEEVKGEEDKKEEEGKEEQEEEKTFIKKYWPLLAILLIVIGGVGYDYVRRKK
ncbi:MAG: choice-of-anchor K domain-containing protein [Candidatus Dojkabacteria bacterium]